MPRSSDKRERLVEAARDLIHRQGYKRTSLADISRESGVPLGNVYYYFKTKDDIAAAVIAGRRQEFETLYQTLESETDPRARLQAWLKALARHRRSVASHGCPVGSLCQELNKERTPLARQADGLLKFQLDWATEQFRLMGRRDAAALGRQLIAGLQGASLLAHALQDPGVFHEAIQRQQAWLEEF